jgi:hypothetical protein
MKERSDSNKNEMDGKQEHSNVFCHDASFLKQAD